MNNLFAKKVPIIFVVWINLVVVYIHPYFLTVFSRGTSIVLSALLIAAMPIIDGLVEISKINKTKKG